LQLICVQLLYCIIKKYLVTIILQLESITVDIPIGDTDTLKQFAENEKKQRIEAEQELHLQVCSLMCKTNKN